MVKQETEDSYSTRGRYTWMNAIQAVLVGIGVIAAVTLIVKSVECATNKKGSCDFIADFLVRYMF